MAFFEKSSSLGAKWSASRAPSGPTSTSHAAEPQHAHAKINKKKVTFADENITRLDLGVLDYTFILSYIRLFARTSKLGLEDVDLVRLAQDAEVEFGHLLGGRATPESIAPLQRWLAGAFLQLSETPNHHYEPERQETPDSESAYNGKAPKRLTPKPPPADTMAPQAANTPMLGQFLNGINGLAKAQNGESLAQWLQLEPEFNDQMKTMIKELRQSYPKGNDAALSDKCEKLLTVASDIPEGASTWGLFPVFVARYLTYLRDLNTDNSDLLDTYNLLIGVQERANSTLNHHTMGHVVLPTVIRCAQIVCKLAIGLDKRPELIAHLKTTQTGDEDSAQKETLPERAANTLRNAFNTCLNDRTLEYGPDGVPAGRKRGIYTLANISLKILFQCGKSRNATFIFENIGDKSPPLASYPKRERVTYLYYLGRYMLQNNHFYRAQKALQAAYEGCSMQPKHIRQRRRILVYLLTCNLILGRFPSAAIMQMPEAQGFAEHFGPIAQAMRTGNLPLFRQHLDLDSLHADWFLHWRILLPLRTRCEVYVWRSLARKTFMLAGKEWSDASGSNKPASIRLDLLTSAFAFMQRKSSSQDSLDGCVDPDLAGANLESDETVSDNTAEVISLLSSLIDQGLVKGGVFYPHMDVFAFQGKDARAKGLEGVRGIFPKPWNVVESKANKDVPGWAKVEKDGKAAKGGGTVVRLSGLQTIGSA